MSLRDLCSIGGMTFARGKPSSRMVLPSQSYVAHGVCLELLYRTGVPLEHLP